MDDALSLPTLAMLEALLAPPDPALPPDLAARAPVLSCIAVVLDPERIALYGPVSDSAARIETLLGRSVAHTERLVPGQYDLLLIETPDDPLPEGATEALRPGGVLMRLGPGPMPKGAHTLPGDLAAWCTTPRTPTLAALLSQDSTLAPLLARASALAAAPAQERATRFAETAALTRIAEQWRLAAVTAKPAARASKTKPPKSRVARVAALPRRIAGRLRREVRDLIRPS